MGRITAIKKDIGSRRFGGNPRKAPLKATGISRTPKRSIPVRAILSAPASVGVIQIVQIRQRFGLSQEEFARVTGYSIRSVAGWEAGNPFSDSARQKLAETDRICTALTQIVGPDALGEWMRSPNPAFEGQTPIQVVERGESDRIWRMIFQINAGVAS